MGDISKPTTVDMYDIKRKQEYDDNYEKIFGHKNAIINKENNLNCSTNKNEKELDSGSDQEQGSIEEVPEGKERKEHTSKQTSSKEGR